MSGDKLFVDTNAVLYLLGGDKTLAEFLEGKNLYLSFITQLELLAFRQLSESEEELIRQFIDECTIIDINDQIKEKVIDIRRKYGVKLPDCIIMASAVYLDIPLITADSDFKKVTELNLVYYER